MSIFSAFKKKDELVLVFDIGSSSIGGSLFYMQDSGSPKIIYTIREPIVFEEDSSIDKILLNTTKTIEIVAKKISTKGLGAPKRIFCTLSSLWIISKTRNVKYERSVPFVFTTKLADSLIEKEILTFEEEHKEDLKNLSEKFRPIEFKNMKTMLNGYTTLDPLNQKAKDLEMNIFISIANDKILSKIEEVIFKHFHAKEIKFSSFLMSSFAVSRDMFIHQENFLLVDIGGESTNISMIKKDMICESNTFQLGCNFMIRGVAKGLNCSLSEAKAFISIYKDGHATENTEKLIEPIIKKLKTEWLNAFQNSLATLSTDISIPATIFVTTDKDFTDLFSKTIKNEQFNQYTLTESKFRVIFLGTEALHGIASFEINTDRDAFLIIESIYINRFLR